MCYVANGHILAFSLPSLKPLFDADFLPLTDYRWVSKRRGTEKAANLSLTDQSL